MPDLPRKQKYRTKNESFGSRFLFGEKAAQNSLKNRARRRVRRARGFCRNPSKI